MRTRALLTAVALTTAGCGVGTDGLDQAQVTNALGTWDMSPAIGNGVAFKDTGNVLGQNVFIGYAGWNINASQAQSWVDALYDARLKDLGVRYLFAVQGPADSLYNGLEIGNSRIGQWLRDHVTPATGFIVIAGHSSGSFVADEFLQQMENGGDPGGAMAGRMVYFNLDGDQRYVGNSGLYRLRRVFHVNAFDHATGVASLNYSVMNSLGATFAGNGGASEYEASGSGCNARVCVHISLINTHPHDPWNGSGLDYADFGSGPVNRWWLDVKTAEAALGQCATSVSTQGAIEAEYAALGGCSSVLGEPTTNETATPDGLGRYNHFQGGSIYWTFFTGAHEVHGAIRARWSAMGWENSPLGYPLTNELVTQDTVGRYNRFAHGAIYFSPATGAHAVVNPIYDAWAATNFENGPLGYPTADDGTFQHGSIVVNADGSTTVLLPSASPPDAGADLDAGQSQPDDGGTVDPVQPPGALPDAGPPASEATEQQPGLDPVMGGCSAAPGSALALWGLLAVFAQRRR